MGLTTSGTGTVNALLSGHTGMRNSGRAASAHEFTPRVAPRDAPGPL